MLRDVDAIADVGDARECSGHESPAVCAEQRKVFRSEEHTSELQSHSDLVCRLLLEKKKKKQHKIDMV